MPKRKGSTKRSEVLGNNPPTHFVRRKSSRNKRRGRSLVDDAAASATLMESAGHDIDGELSAAPARLRRAPRPVDPPSRNPNIFSYTYRIWKSF